MPNMTLIGAPTDTLTLGEGESAREYHVGDTINLSTEDANILRRQGFSFTPGKAATGSDEEQARRASDKS